LQPARASRYNRPLVFRACRLLAIALIVLGAVVSPAIAENRAGSISRQIVGRVNDQRAAAGLAPLRATRALSRVARSHSRFLSHVGRLQHESADGSSFDRRLRRVLPLRAAGEDLAFGPSASWVVAAWMASPAHRACILSPSFRLLGVGVVRGRAGGGSVLWVTADFGA